MEQFRDYLVIDRTQGDVDRAMYLRSLWNARARVWMGTQQEYAEWTGYLKGTYDAADLNRVTRACAYVAAKLARYGYDTGLLLPPAVLITTEASPKGGGSPGGGVFYVGETVTLTAAPADLYTFVRWEEKGQTVSEDTVYRFPAGRDRHLTAVFEAPKGGMYGVVGIGQIGQARIGIGLEGA